jgi:hypothetical protein
LYALDKTGQKLLAKPYEDIMWPAIRSWEMRNPKGCITGMEIMNPTKPRYGNKHRFRLFELTLDDRVFFRDLKFGL